MRTGVLREACFYGLFQSSWKYSDSILTGLDSVVRKAILNSLEGNSKTAVLSSTMMNDTGVSLVLKSLGSSTG